VRATSLDVRDLSADVEGLDARRDCASRHPTRSVAGAIQTRPFAGCSDENRM
jgi:hypothetical protein